MAPEEPVPPSLATVPGRGPSLYVARRTGTFSAVDEDAPVQVLSLREVDWNEATPVGAKANGRFVTLGDAIDHDVDVRDAMLVLSPEPGLGRFRKVPFRLAMLLSPIAWGYFAESEWRELTKVEKDARRVLDSDEFKQAEMQTENVGLAKEAKERRGKIETAIAMRKAYTLGEGAITLAAVLVIALGLRRYRAIPIALGFGALFWWLFQAGRPGHCFKPSSWSDYVLAFFGLGGAVVSLVLAPSETTIATRLRKRLRLPVHPAPGRPWMSGERRLDTAAALAAAAAGLLLPLMMELINRARAGNPVRILFFVGFCSIVFIGFLAWRKELSRVPPRLVDVALAASLGFGVLVAADVAVRASFATVLEVQTCIAPDSKTALNKVQEQSSKETTNARKETQTGLLPFLVAVLAAPFSEEMLYRGTLQRIARRAFGARNAIMLSSMIFGVAHMFAFPNAFYMHVGLGLAFSAIFELAGGGAVGVIASATTHLMWNYWLSQMPVL